MVDSGQDSQNLPEPGATSSYRINSWPARCTDNRQNPQRLRVEVFSAHPLKMYNIMPFSSNDLLAHPEVPGDDISES